ncbi:MAG: hypothetical protein AAF849_02985 [Bacteroidota bacterium]
MVNRPFEQWLFEDVEIEFGLERIKKLPELEEWIKTENLIEFPQEIEKLRVSLAENIDTWNKSDLQTLFVQPLLSKFDFNHPPEYRIFVQRKIELQRPAASSFGKIEWMIATGKQRPRKPFLFFQKSQAESRAERDVLGQLLLSMVDAQSKNEDADRPLYACYTIGRFWFFVLLTGKKYGVSRAFDASQKDDMGAMFKILKRVEQHIHKVLNVEAEVTLA